MNKKWKAKPGILLSLFSDHQSMMVCAGNPPDINGSGAFATGKYRNLFMENGHSKKEIAQKINTAFNQLVPWGYGTCGIFRSR